MVQINELPTELLEVILSYLSIEEKFQCERVCRRWQQVLFTSIRGLKFEVNLDQFNGFHKHVLREAEQLPAEVNIQDDVMKSIVSKCGRHIQSFRGFVSYVVVQTIAEHCECLHCIDVYVDDQRTLDVLGKTYGKQLTCVTLRFYDSYNIASFLSTCLNLTSLGISSDRTAFPTSLTFLDQNSPQKEFPQCLKFLRNLAIQGDISLGTLKELMIFSNLETVSITLNQNINESDEWVTLLKKWSNLKALSVYVAGSSCYCEPLPPNLTHLALHAYCDSLPDDGSFSLSTYLPYLESCSIYKSAMSSEYLEKILEDVACFYPNLQKLCISTRTSPSQNGHWLIDSVSLTDDQALTPLLRLTGLKHLSLGSDFIVSDSFFSKLVTDLDQLTLFGTRRPTSNYYDECYLVPAGEMFWNAVRDKAVSHPTYSFSFIGKASETMHLSGDFPPNVSLILEECHTIRLTNTFAQSYLWKKWTARWLNLVDLTIEIVDKSFNLSGLPKSLQKLTLECYNEVLGHDNEPLTFTTLLPKLKQLSIYQQTMSNSQLMATLQCISKFCPQLTNLHISRGNENPHPVDSCAKSLFQCHYLEQICLSESFVVSDEFGEQLAHELTDLCKFGCGHHRIGFTCGPLFLKALIKKVQEGCEVTLKGGPSRLMVLRTIEPLTLPRGLHFL